MTRRLLARLLTFAQAAAIGGDLSSPVRSGLPRRFDRLFWAPQAPSGPTQAGTADLADGSAMTQHATRVKVLPPDARR